MRITPYLLWFNGFEQLDNESIYRWVEHGGLTTITIWEQEDAPTWRLYWACNEGEFSCEAASWRILQYTIASLGRETGHDIRLTVPNWYTGELLEMDQFGFEPLYFKLHPNI